MISDALSEKPLLLRDFRTQARWLDVGCSVESLDNSLHSGCLEDWECVGAETFEVGK